MIKISIVNGVDFSELEKELEEFAKAEQEAETYSLSDYYNSMKPPETASKEDSSCIKIGDEPVEEYSDILSQTNGFVTEEDVMKNASLFYPEKKVCRSMLLELFTPQMCLEIEKLSRTFSISNNKKADILKEWFTEWGIKYFPLGPGTNRLGVMMDGYVGKIAFDKDGKIDNQREFIYSIPLYPHCIKCYETLFDGLMATFEYVEMWNIDDFFKSQDKMREILQDIARRGFLIGDVGISSQNYVNWAWRDDKPVILDYAYIYDVAYNKFQCHCSPSQMLYYDKDFNNLICPNCGKKYAFKDIRKKISRADQEKEIGDISKRGYVLSAPEQEVDFNPRFVYGAFDDIYKKLLKKKKREELRLMRIGKKKREEDEEIMSSSDIIENIKKGEWRN